MTNSAKHARAIEAAAEVFMRYGFNRTTMGDIARRAEMSRPALYLLFPSKEEAFEAAVDHLTEMRLREVQSALDGAITLSDRLFTACDLWLVQVFDLKMTNPDACDMDDLAFGVVRRTYDRMQAFVAGILNSAGVCFEGTTSEQLARNLVFSVRGLGAVAKDVEDMRAMVHLQVATLSAALQRNEA